MELGHKHVLKNGEMFLNCPLRLLRKSMQDCCLPRAWLCVFSPDRNSYQPQQTHQFLAEGG